MGSGEAGEEGAGEGWWEGGGGGEEGPEGGGYDLVFYKGSERGVLRWGSWMGVEGRGVFFIFACRTLDFFLFLS